MDTPKNNIPNFTTAPFWLLSDPDLTPFDKVVWLVIKYRQGQNSHAWPSQEQIAEDAGGVSEKTVQRSAVRLQKRGWLKVKRPTQQGRTKTNHYSITAPKKVDSKSTFIKKGGLRVRQKVDSKSDKLYKENYIHNNICSKTKKTFVPPTPKEVREYAATINFPDIDAEHFCDYYAAEDWTLSTGKKMRSWKRAVLTWRKIEHRSKEPESLPIPEPAMPTEEQLAIALGEKE